MTTDENKLDGGIALPAILRDETNLIGVFKVVCMNGIDLVGGIKITKVPFEINGPSALVYEEYVGISAFNS